MDLKKGMTQLLSESLINIRVKEIYPIYLLNSIPNKVLKNIENTFGADVQAKEIIGFYDTSARNTGKSGYLFTMDKFYYKALLKKSEKLWYEDIEQIEIINEENEERLYLYSYGDKKIELSNVYINCLPMKEFLEKAKLIVFKQDSSKIFDIDYKDSTKNLFGSNAAGHSVGAYGQVNKGFEEEIFQARQGHGFAAERANHLYDRLAGRDSRIIGGDNAKDGADRLLDSIYIQTKYHQNASATLSNCFENGKFRYYTDTGQPMQIEVPADQYDAILAKMKDYIHQGKIDGVSNVEDAMKIIKKGQFTYQQAKNIAEAGTIESLVYDAASGAVISMSALGVTAVISFATSIWHGENVDVAFKIAAVNGLKVGGTAFATTVLAGQLSKAGLNSALVGNTEAITALIGPKASAILINAF